MLELAFRHKRGIEHMDGGSRVPKHPRKDSQHIVLPMGSPCSYSGIVHHLLGPNSYALASRSVFGILSSSCCYQIPWTSVHTE